MRHSWAGAHFLHGERKLPILGKVSMDMIVIDLDAAPELGEGDWVELQYCPYGDARGPQRVLQGWAPENQNKVAPAGL